MTIRISQYVNTEGQATIASEDVDAEAVPVDVSAGQGSSWDNLDGALEDIAEQLDIPDLTVLFDNKIL